MKKEYNPTKFKINYFSSISKFKLTPCEYRCLMLLLEGKEYTKTQIGQVLGIVPQNIGKAMLHLEKIGLVEKTRVEGRNAFFTVNLNFNIPDDEVIDKNQLLL